MKERGTGSGQIGRFYEECKVPLIATNTLRVHFVLGIDHLVHILRNVSLRQGEPSENCVSWAKEALEADRKAQKSLWTVNFQPRGG
jgi:hypothetical protein